jgi:hypothetical protein
VFYDKEGNVIQLYEDPAQPAIPCWTKLDYPISDFRSPEQKAWAESPINKKELYENSAI